MSEDAGRVAKLAYHASLPKKRMGAGCLLFDDAGQVLLVKPGYKPVWEIPGGVVEADESPLACCRREVAEELGLSLSITRLLVVDYTPGGPDRTEALMFVFWGGQLTPDDVAQIHLDGDEIVEFGFFAADALPADLTPTLRRRILAAWQQVVRAGAVYLENQEPPGV